MAVLEAFVYDPLINWRLLTPNTKTANAEAVSRLRLRCLAVCSCARSLRVNWRRAMRAKRRSKAEGQLDARLLCVPAQPLSCSPTPIALGGTAIKGAGKQVGGEDDEADGCVAPVMWRGAWACSDGSRSEQLNERAITVISRISNKLTG